MSDLDIKPFKIVVDEADIVDLNSRLARTRWPDVTPQCDWKYGTDATWVREMATYWHDCFDWRKQEAMLNTFPQFTATIDSQTIHFIHVKSPDPNALPLILTHGWPSTFADFAEMIGPLSDPGRYGHNRADAFHVVVPSVPGFGFSGPPQATGWNSARIAKAWKTLMRGLGYEQFVAHGGDVGTFITREMAMAQGDGLLGIHVLEIFTFPTGEPGELDDLTDVDRQRMTFMSEFDKLSGHQRMQQTRPFTPAYGLTDSPVGQLAWIGDSIMGLGRFAPPTQRDIDTVLTTVSIYWFTKSAGTSACWYYEDAKAGLFGQKGYNATPTGVALFPYNYQSIRKIAERTNNIVHWSCFDEGGHFAALDVPDILVGDIRKYCRRFR